MAYGIDSMGLGKLFFLLFFLVTSRNNRLDPQTWAQTDISQRDKIHLSFNKKKKKKKKRAFLMLVTKIQRPKIFKLKKKKKKKWSTNNKKKKKNHKRMKSWYLRVYFWWISRWCRQYTVREGVAYRCQSHALITRSLKCELPTPV